MKIYESIPAWMTAAVAKKNCSQCHHRLKQEDIIAIGVRELAKGKSTLYCEHLCPSCEYRSMTSFGGQKQTSVEDICYLLLEEILRKKSAKKCVERKAKETTLRASEVDEFIDFVKNVKTHDEFMKAIGSDKYIITDEDEDDGNED